MSLNKKLFWGGLGWVLGGPIGGILGYAWGSISDVGSLNNYQGNYSKSTIPHRMEQESDQLDTFTRSYR